MRFLPPSEIVRGRGWPSLGEPDVAGESDENSTERRRGSRRRWIGLGCLVAVSIGVLSHHPLLVGFARLFRVDDPAPSDALIVLTGSWNGDRSIRAAE